MTTDEALEYASCILGAPSGKTEETVVILAAEVRRLRQRHAELEAQLAKAPGIDLEDCTILVRDGDTLWVNGTVFTLHGYRIEPKERHAEEVEAAFREAWAWLGQEPYCETADDEWLASEAKARLT